ncbi:GNAT family N-acetyltransferase [Paenibacillus pini]|uniref:N-acetyltransferase n=1 Tax=Paenibacillus pini JCM 16418 TaxID=1236976 RepID=W7YU67_9BACL|nr:GNAT family N-acetyltransferase [Paenibacillus pini]GAF10753.1 N-acetyltransferase [Paenibacillus pini JCM 16418]
MIKQLSLQNEDIIDQIWNLQQIAYRLEAEIIGFMDIPPLLDTHESLRALKEIFYGLLDEEGNLIGAVAVESESKGSLTLTRMMVHPNHFRKGIAGQLIQYVFDHHPDIERFIVSTGAKNRPAFSLYVKYGFVPFDTFTVAPGVELTTFHKNI